MHPITESPAMTIDHNKTAQLYWDTQDSGNAGWSLRYWTEDGREHSVDLDAVEEASIERLAYAVRREIGVDMLLSAAWHIDNSEQKA